VERSIELDGWQTLESVVQESTPDKVRERPSLGEIRHGFHERPLHKSILLTKQSLRFGFQQREP
jgi:hypothetical protein